MNRRTIPASASAAAIVTALRCIPALLPAIGLSLATDPRETTDLAARHPSASKPSAPSSALPAPTPRSSASAKPATCRRADGRLRPDVSWGRDALVAFHSQTKNRGAVPSTPPAPRRSFIDLDLVPS